MIFKNILLGLNGLNSEVDHKRLVHYKRKRLVMYLLVNDILLLPIVYAGQTRSVSND